MTDAQSKNLVQQLAGAAAILEKSGDVDGRGWLPFAERERRRQRRERDARRRLRELRELLAGLRLE